MNEFAEQSFLLQTFFQLFEAHTVRASLAEDFVVVEDKLWCSVKFYHEWSMADGRVMVQLDFFIYFEGKNGRYIKQSLAGWGQNTKEAVMLAFDNFNKSTLHIVLGAFFSEHEKNIIVETWPTAQAEYRVYFDSIVTLCADEETKKQLTAVNVFHTLKQCVKSDIYTEKINWVSFFVNGDVIEVLLNNQIWPHATQTFKNLSWPHTGHYFSTRIFLVFKQM